MNEKHIEKVKENVKKNVKNIRDVIGAFREGFGVPDRIKWRDRIGKFQKQRFQPQEGNSRQMPQVQERFGFIRQFLQPQESQYQEPAPEQQLSETEIILLNEHRRELSQKIESRAKEEAEQKKRDEEAESLRKAKLRIAVNQN